MSIKERCTQANWSVSCGPQRCRHLGKKPLKKTYLRKNIKNEKKYKNCPKKMQQKKYLVNY